MFLQNFKRCKCYQIFEIVAKIVKVAFMCQWTMLDSPTYHLNPYLSVISEFAVLIQCQMNFGTILDLLIILLE